MTEHAQYRIDAVSARMSELCDGPHCEPPAHDDDAVEILDALALAEQAQWAEAIARIFDPVVEWAKRNADLLSRLERERAGG